MLSSYHPFAVISGWLAPRKTPVSAVRYDRDGRRLPPYYLPGFEPSRSSAPVAPLPDMIEEIVEAARVSLEGLSEQPASQPDAPEEPAPSLPEPAPSPRTPDEMVGVVSVEGQALASEAVEVLHHLRRGEWQSRSSYLASLHVLSYDLFSDSCGELLSRTSRLISDLESQGLVRIVDADASLSGFTCVKLRSAGRMLADRTLSPLVNNS